MYSCQPVVPTVRVNTSFAPLDHLMDSLYTQKYTLTRSCFDFRTGGHVGRRSLESAVCISSLLSPHLQIQSFHAQRMFRSTKLLSLEYLVFYIAFDVSFGYPRRLEKSCTYFINFITKQTPNKLLTILQSLFIYFVYYYNDERYDGHTKVILI